MDIIRQTRRHATGALRNFVAVAPTQEKIRLCCFQSNFILDALADAALNDTDGAVKLKAFETIRKLAIQDTAEAMIQNQNFVAALKDALSSTSEDDSDKMPENFASGTLMVLKRSITPEMQGYEALKELLESINQTGEPAGQDELDECCAVETAAV